MSQPDATAGGASPASTVGGLPMLVAAVVPVATVVLLGVADHEMGVFPAFLPAFLALVLACDVLTATLLVARYVVGGSSRLLALSWAYAWSASIIVPYFLTFPGLVTDAGLFGTSPSATASLWASWHVGLAALIGLALAPWPRGWQPALDRAHRGYSAAISLLAVLMLAAVTAATVILGDGLVPTLVADGERVLTERYGLLVGAAITAAFGAACLGLAQRARDHGLETWALVALVASAGDAALTLLGRDRFTVGWYGARALALVAAVVVLGALLREVVALYRRLTGNAAQLRAQNAELREAQALRDQLSAVVSHEMRNPLTALQGYLEMLSSPDEDPAPHEAPGDPTAREARRLLERCLALTRRLSLMTEDLLAAETSRTGTLHVVLQELEVTGQLGDLLGSFPELDLRIHADDLRGRRGAGQAGVRVVADPLRLQQVLANLVRNAQKYGAEPVEVVVRTEGSWVVFEVTDAGAGVPADFAPYLFDRFSRASADTSTPGVGLGLAVARELALAHEGDLAYRAADHAFVLSLRRSADDLATERDTWTAPLAPADSGWQDARP